MLNIRLGDVFVAHISIGENKSDSEYAVNSFWDGFFKLALSKGVPSSKAKFYLNWAHKFAVSIGGIPLKQRALCDLRSFIDELHAAGTPPWQVEQARKALAMLYRDYLGIDPKQLPERRDEPAEFRDAIRAPMALQQTYGALFSAVECTIRTLHYSPKTLQAYLLWSKRFLAYLGMPRSAHSRRGYG